MKPTISQIKHFWKLVGKDKADRDDYWAFLKNHRRSVVSFPTAVDKNIRLIELIKKAVCKENFESINGMQYGTGVLDKGSLFSRKKLGKGVCKVNLELKPFLNGETCEECAKRLRAVGYTLENIGELVVFLANHPEEVKKWKAVFALGNSCHLTYLCSGRQAPRVSVIKKKPCLHFDMYYQQTYRGSSVLVSYKK